MIEDRELLSFFKYELKKQNTFKVCSDIYLFGGFSKVHLPLVVDSLGEIFGGRIKIRLFNKLQDFRLSMDSEEKQLLKLSNLPSQINPQNSLNPEIKAKQLKLNKNEKIDIEKLIQKLIDLGYINRRKVWEPGEFSLLGDLLSIWIKGWKNIVRVSLFGYDVEEISIVNPKLRTKVKIVDQVLIPPVRKLSKKNQKQILLGNETASTTVESNFVYIETLSSQDNQVLSFWNRESDSSWNFQLINIPLSGITGTSYTELSKSNLAKILQNYQKQGYKINAITTKEEVTSLENQIGSNICFWPKKIFNKDYIRQGFILHNSKQLFLTDYELKGEVDLAYTGNQNQILTEDLFTRISIDDYVVHEDHGVGKYAGIEKIKDEDYFVIQYKGKDKLYVPLNKSSKISRYVGSSPKLSKLRGGGWKRIKSSIKKETEKIAKELLQLYSLRESSNFQKILDTKEKLEEFELFVKEFEYEDTEDQIITTQEIVKDLQDVHPMDRLLIGDVGFGKTEVAVRAMYALIQAGYQVAFLAPTTILVEQHKEVLRQRFKGFDVNIEALSRLRTKKESEQIVKRLEDGHVDLIIGTHSLLSDRVKFKNLGLIVIDEEQRFGVKHKEKLKARRIDVNVLSMTATPIPRSLQMSLSGIRDISVISTPPPNRKPIRNAFHKFSWNRVFSSLQKEFERNGQAYFLHNRVRDIDALALKIQAAFPDKTVDVAHGQLPNKVLGKVMSEMAAGKIDVLVTTTIIENGIDLQNVNTLIVDDIEHLGLAQMYQIRGRIGRGERQGFAYFLYKSLKGDSKLRLEALQEFSGLGSGFLLANRDLEIRGAGSILGKEQSGVIERVGYHLYIKMLRKEINKIKKEMDEIDDDKVKELLRF